jgi:hypothetical protein
MPLLVLVLLITASRYCCNWRMHAGQPPAVLVPWAASDARQPLLQGALLLVLLMNPPPAAPPHIPASPLQLVPRAGSRLLQASATTCCCCTQPAMPAVVLPRWLLASLTQPPSPAAASCCCRLLLLLLLLPLCRLRCWPAPAPGLPTGPPRTPRRSCSAPGCP